MFITTFPYQHINLPIAFVELFVTSSLTESRHRPQWAWLFGCGGVVSSSSSLFLFRVAASSYQYLRSPALCPVSLSLFCFTYHSTSVSVFPYFAVHSLLSSTFPLLNLLQSFSTHGPTICLTSLIFSLMLPTPAHMLLFLHS